MRKMDLYIENVSRFKSCRVFGFNYEINITEMYENIPKKLFDYTITLIMNVTIDVLRDINIRINFPAFVKMLEKYATQNCPEDDVCLPILKKLYTQLKLELNIVRMRLFAMPYGIVAVECVDDEDSVIDCGSMVSYADLDDMIRLGIDGSIGYITLFDV